MLGLGMPELIFIFILALLIFGPRRLPELGRTIGRGMAEFRGVSANLQRTIKTELALDEQLRPPALVRTHHLDTLVTPTSIPVAAAPPPPSQGRKIVSETSVDEGPAEPT